jgi:hypothetical protein
MNNHFNNLYGSGGYISCQLTATLFLAASAGLYFSFKNLGRIYNKMDRVGLLGRRLGGVAGKTTPHMEIHAALPQMAQKMLALVPVGGGGGVEMLLLIDHAQGSSSMERLKRHKRVFFSFSFHFIVYKDTAQSGSFMHRGCPFFLSLYCAYVCFFGTGEGA